MKGIILASHGKLAEGLLDTLQIFSGEPQQMEALCLMPGEDVSDFVTKLQDALSRVDTGEGAVIFCDLLFGSPCNCSARLLADETAREKLEVITGMNLPMVLEYVTSRENGMDSEALVETGKQGIVDFKKMMEARNS